VAATVELNETNGPAATQVETNNVSNVNMGSSDTPNLVPATYPITAMADGHAYEKWVRLYVSLMGGSSQVDNLKVWLSSLGGGWKTGEGMSTNCRVSAYVQATYPTPGPVNTNSAVATQVMPESEPAGPNLGIGGSLAGAISAAPAYSDYGVFQLDVTASTPAGALNTKTFTMQWDEQ